MIKYSHFAMAMFDFAMQTKLDLVSGVEVLKVFQLYNIRLLCKYLAHYICYSYLIAVERWLTYLCSDDVYT